MYINSNISFAGIQGKVLSISPHGSYLTVQLSKRIVIVGTYSNKFGWSGNPEQQSGFVSFITYIGAKPNEEFALRDQINYYGGNIHSLRQSKRNKHFPLEFKVYELTVPSLLQLFNELQ
ncbi:hypothetical protein [Planktothrix sp.]|jgi:hypothetical protein|uniref:hypothetical protein n=1 Tax=Planktothrix sp. TaxID=3088171 RepID=UPI0038D51574